MCHLTVLRFPIATTAFEAGDDAHQTRAFSRSAATRSGGPDPFRLVLLAEQEFDGQRLARARRLIEAAYAAYDQCTMSGQQVLRFHPK
jgi:hypothetical protein